MKGYTHAEHYYQQHKRRLLWPVSGITMRIPVIDLSEATSIALATNPAQLSLHDQELLEVAYDNLVEAGMVISVIDFDRFKIGAVCGFDPAKEDEDE